MPVFGSMLKRAFDLPNAMGLPGPPMPPPMPPPALLRLSRKSPPTSSSGNARLPSRFSSTLFESSVFECAAKSTFLARNFCSSSWLVPGS